MPTTRSANRPPPKRTMSPDSDDEEEEYVAKRSGSTRGRRGASTRGRGGRGGAKTATTGKPIAKRGRKKKSQSDSEDEQTNFDSDHLHDELKKCHSILLEFAKDSHESYTFAFRKPVDTVALGLTDYHEIVKKPMDLLTMKKKLIGEEYDTAVDFKTDFKLIISNCLLYNHRSDPVSQMAIQFRDAFVAKWKEAFPLDDDDFGKNDAEEDIEEEDNDNQNSEEQKRAMEAAASPQAESAKSDDGHQSDSSDNSKSLSIAPTIAKNRTGLESDVDSTGNAAVADSTTDGEGTV